MPRRTGGTGNEAFRVIIESKGLHTGLAYREVFGPYGTLGAAKGVLTHETHHAYRHEAHGHIERAITVWKEVTE